MSELAIDRCLNATVLREALTRLGARSALRYSAVLGSTWKVGTEIGEISLRLSALECCAESFDDHFLKIRYACYDCSVSGPEER